jgi:hypothetical protein
MTKTTRHPFPYGSLSGWSSTARRKSDDHRPIRRYHKVVPLAIPRYQYHKVVPLGSWS